MLYIILKTIIETTIEQYICQWCQWKITLDSIRILGIGETVLNLGITCPHCQLNSHIHAEVANIEQNMLNTDAAKDIIHKAIKKSENAIKDIDIQNIEKSLTETQSVEDLLK